MGHLDEIQTALKALKKSKKIETNFYHYFKTSLIIWNDETARPQRSLTAYSLA